MSNVLRKFENFSFTKILFLQKSCKNFATTFVFAKLSAQKVRIRLITIIFYLKIIIFAKIVRLKFCLRKNFARIFIIFATFGKLFEKENFPFNPI
jgi:hypothetical protein